MLVLEGKERGDLDPRFHQSLSPLSEGNPLDLDLGVLRVLPSFFLSFSSLALVASVGFESEGFGHSVCLAIAFGASVGVHGDTWKLQVEKLITLGCLGTLELVPLGCLGALDVRWCLELNHYGVKLRASVGVSN